MRFFSKLKNEKGSITAFVLASILFFIVVFIGVYVNSSNKIQKQHKDIRKVQQSYDIENVNELYEETYNKYYYNEEI